MTTRRRDPRTAAFACRLLAAAVLLLAVSAPLVLALEPPPEGQVQALRATGELNRRLDLVRRLDNHRVDPFLLKRAIYKTARRTLQAQGKSAAEVDRMAPLMAPPPGWQGMPSTGNVRILALLIEFQDQVHTNSRLAIHNLLFGVGNPLWDPYESLARYYERASYQQLDLSHGNTLGWYQTAYDRTAVVQTRAGRENLIREVLNHYDAQGHDFSQYDNDGDGTVDYFVVIWAGPDTGWGTFWWGYQTWFSDTTFTLDGVRLGKYSWQWESRPVGGMFTPLVVIHETGHALGIPDFYDYDDSVGPDGGVGGLDMMDANRGDHNCFSKWMLDWITPTVVAAGAQSLTLAASGTSQDCVLVSPGITTGDLFGEYFLVQNRHRVGNDSRLPADGMLIWHVDAHLDATGQSFAYDNSFTAHKLLRLMEADGLEEIETGDGNADAGDYYQQGDSFGPCTTPSSKRYDGTDSGVSVSNISAPGPQMSATVGVVPAAAADYAATALAINPTSADPGDQVQVSFTVKNIGGNPSACISTAVFLSADAVITTADTQLGVWGLPNCDLAACTEHTQTETVTIPAGTADGSYFIGVMADVNNYQAEADEANNTAAQPIAVGGGDQDGWTSGFFSRVLRPDQVAALREYRDRFLKRDGTGRRWVAVLYENSTAALGVLLRHPQLALSAGEILRENMAAVAQVLAGGRPRLSDPQKVAAYLADFADKAPGPLAALALEVRDGLLAHRAGRQPFLGFALP